jgi:hypothetical protein
MMMSTQDTAAFPVGAADRADILAYASFLLDSPDRADGARVTVLAVPLLEWAGCAASKDDLQSRMRALARANANTYTRRPRLTPAEFVDQARTYYGFMTGAAA